MASRKAIARWLADPRVADAYAEDDGGTNNYWIDLKNGWINTYTETHAIHEVTVKECDAQLKHDVKPCACASCRGEVGPND